MAMMRLQLRILFIGLVWAFLARTAPTQAEPLRATPDDRAAVEACLKLVGENAVKEAQGTSQDEAPGAAGRLAAAARDALTQRESCIGGRHNILPTVARRSVDYGDDRLQYPRVGRLG
jgi:hypothetical protein